MATTSKISELNELYTEAEHCDKDLFAEQRSNVLLISGEHYAKISRDLGKAIRSRTDISEEQKIRLVKNHVQKIHKTYVNAITSAAPGVQIVAENDKELKDKKAAQLRESIWSYGKRKYRLREKIRSFAEDYCGIGETFAEIYWDPDAGEFVGYAQEVQVDEQGNEIPVFEADGVTPKASKNAVFSGDFVFKRHFAFNTLRDPRSKEMQQSPYIIFREMVDIKDLMKKYGEDDAKKKFIQEEHDRTFFVFDGQKGSYSKAKGQSLVRTFYFRPCIQYPMGYYYITTEGGILDEGELPLGVFPVAYAGFEQIQTSARSRSPVKHIRPYQAEINRKASKMAEHQISLGDDKIILQNGSKISQGALFPGVRGYTITGEKPTVLGGRSGEQYLASMQSDITEMYDVMGVKEIMAEKDGTVDAYVLLFRSASQKKQFSANIERFEQFLIDMCSIFMKLAPHYYDDSRKIEMIGTNEFVNLEELRNSEDLNFQIKIEPMAEDIETQLGKQLVLSQALQYSAQQLGPNGVAKLIKNMPFGGIKESFDDLTLDSDIADNMILALDRGERPEPSVDDTHDYMVKRITKRMRQPDFKLLSPEAQSNYEMLRGWYSSQKALQEAKLIAAKSEYIPTGGAMVACDLYVKDPKNPMSQKRARVPYESLNWLIRQIELQGTSLESLEGMAANDQINIMEGASRNAAQGGTITNPGTQPNNPNSPPQLGNEGPPSLIQRATQGPAVA